MSLPQSILELERRDAEPGGEPTLGLALEVAIEEWRAGNRDRELRLHLLFLCWYCNLEPPFVTGLDDSRVPSSGLPALFEEVYATLAEGIYDDPEGLYVVGLMAQLASWCVGDDPAMWEARGREFIARYRQLLPGGLPATAFEGRGAYGDYFAGQVVVTSGF